MKKFNNAAEVQKFVKENNIDFISFLIVDIDGRIRNVTIPAENFTEKVIENGIGFDASNLGFAPVNNSDMILIPDLNSAFFDPSREEKNTLSFMTYIIETDGGKNFDQDLRHLILRAVNLLKEEGVADEVKVGIELEFNILDSLYSRLTLREVSYKISSSEFTSPSSGEEIYRIAANRGYFRSAPNDHHFEIRNEIVKALKSLNYDIKYHHHEVASSQSEIEFAFMPIETTADATVLAKNICHKIALKNDKIITFIPKLIPGEAGNGLHMHIFLLKNGENIFYDSNGLYNLSKEALYFIGGIFKHASSLLAFTNPTTVSYRRLIPGLEAPVKAVFAKSNRSAAIRIPGYIKDPAVQRFEFRTMDATCNPYLAYTAIIMAGLDGIRNQIDPQKEGYGPIEKNLYSLPKEELDKIKSFPATLEEALNALEEDYEYLTYKNIFPVHLIEKWIQVKRKDIKEMREIPHPWEIARYYDL